MQGVDPRGPFFSFPLSFCQVVKYAALEINVVVNKFKLSNLFLLIYFCIFVFHLFLFGSIFFTQSTNTQYFKHILK